MIFIIKEIINTKKLSEFVFPIRPLSQVIWKLKIPTKVSEIVFFSLRVHGLWHIDILLFSSAVVFVYFQMKRLIQQLTRRNLNNWYQLEYFLVVTKKIKMFSTYYNNTGGYSYLKSPKVILCANVWGILLWCCHIDQWSFLEIIANKTFFFWLSIWNSRKFIG